MDLISDLRSKLSFGSSRGDGGDDRSKEMVAALMGSGDFVVAEIDRAGLITGANEALCRCRGVILDELVGSGLLYLVNAEERDAVAVRVREAFETGAGGEVLARLLPATGGPMPVIRWGLIPLAGEDGAVASCLCVGVDLAASLEALPPGPEAKKAQGELQEAQEALEGAEKEVRRLKKQLKEARESVPTGPPPPVPEELFAEEEGPLTLREIERRHIFHTLKECKGRVSGAKGAAAILGLHPNTLRSRMEKLGIGKVA